MVQEDESWDSFGGLLCACYRNQKDRDISKVLAAGWRAVYGQHVFVSLLVIRKAGFMHALSQDMVETSSATHTVSTRPGFFEAFLSHAPAYAIISLEGLPACQGSLHFANLHGVQLSQRSRQVTGLLWALLKTPLLWSSWCYQVFWQCCSFYKWGWERAQCNERKKTNSNRKHLNKQMHGLPLQPFPWPHDAWQKLSWKWRLGYDEASNMSPDQAETSRDRKGISL